MFQAPATDPSDRPANDDSPPATAKRAGLTYASSDQPGFTRRRHGRGFSYSPPAGGKVSDRRTLARFRALVIPPAWRDVWICPDPNGHVQAIGYDEKGRRQYIYHPEFRRLREAAKFRRLIAFAAVLPRVRAQVDADMRQVAHGRRQVLATVIHLLETTMIRVGSRAYARANQSFGLTTLEPRHVEIVGTRLRFDFRGKSGRAWKLDIRDRRIVRILRSCQELPGQGLFRYVDEDGAPQAVTSDDVNNYLRGIAGADVSAKDFRTWHGTVMAATALAECGPQESQTRAKRCVSDAIRQVAARLGNTPTICRRCYVHPAVVDAYMAGELRLEAPELIDGLSHEETAVLVFLEARQRLSGGEGD